MKGLVEREGGGPARVSWQQCSKCGGLPSITSTEPSESLVTRGTAPLAIGVHRFDFLKATPMIRPHPIQEVES